ncbi:MAG TPA: heme-copper oxidase subunit III [Polyangia bacterium]|nr:heme-copper oxidase subunit III [Polyangia bacterium]
MAGAGPSGGAGGDTDRARLRAARHAEGTSYLGMAIFLGGWAMMFAALFFSYGVMRIHAATWPPPGALRLPIAMPLVNTLVLLASSVTLQLGLYTIRNWRVAELPRWIVATIGLGVAFLGLQVAVWRDVWARGLRPDTSTYGSVFYALTAVHALHVVAGLIALVVVLVPALRGQYRKNRHTPVRMMAMFWHFIDIVWVLMFLAVYVF